jgi:hypothetical protein
LKVLEATHLPIVVFVSELARRHMAFITATDFYQRGRINYLNSHKKSCTAKLENENGRSKKTQKTGSRSIAPVAGFAGQSESTFCGHKNLKNHFLMSSLRQQ